MKIARLPLAVALVVAFPALAEEVGPPSPPPAPAGEVVRTKAVILQPLPWAFGAYGGAFEIAVQPRLSLVFGLNLFAFSFATNSSSTGGGSFSSGSSTSVLGGGIQPGIAFYLVGRAPSGLWLSPKLELAYLAVTSSSSFTNGTMTNSNSSTTSGFIYGGHAMVGYTHAFEIGFTLQGGVGLGFASSNFSSNSSSGGPGGNPVSLLGSFGRLALGAGWSF